MRRGLALLAVLALIVVAVGACATEEPAAEEPAVEDPAVGMPNPASVHCEEQGYTLEIRSEEDGEVGYCIFPDGTECEEWAFFREECGPGTPKP